MPDVDSLLQNPVGVNGGQPEIAALCKEANALRNDLYPTIISGKVEEERQKLNVQDLTRAIERVNQLADPKLIPDDRRLFQELSSALHESGTLNSLQEVREELQETVNLLSTAKKPPPNAWKEWVRYGDLKRRLEALQAANELARAAETALGGNGPALKHAADVMVANVTSAVTSTAGGLAPHFATRLRDFQQAVKSFDPATAGVLNREEARLLDNVRFALCAVTKQQSVSGPDGLRKASQELERAASTNSALVETAKIASSAHDLLRELRLMEISSRGPDALLRATEALLAPLEQRLMTDKATLDGIEAELKHLRGRGLRAIQNMWKLADLGLTYQEKQVGIGPALLLPPGVVKNGQVRVGRTAEDWYAINNTICCSTATLHAVVFPQFDTLKKVFGPEVMAEAVHQWNFNLENLGDDEKGPIAVVFKLGLGRGIQLQDIQKGDLIQWWKKPEGHSAIVIDVDRDPESRKVRAITIISANRQNNPAVPAIRLESKNLTQLEKDGFHVHAARLLVDPSDTTFNRDKLLQSQAADLERHIRLIQRTVDELNKLKNGLGKDPSLREAVERLVELLELYQFDPSALEAAIERIWVESGGEGEPPQGR